MPKPQRGAHAAQFERSSSVVSTSSNAPLLVLEEVDATGADGGAINASQGLHPPAVNSAAKGGGLRPASMTSLASLAGPHGLRQRRSRGIAATLAKSNCSVVPEQGDGRHGSVPAPQPEDVCFSPALCIKAFIYEMLPMYSSLPVLLCIECVLGQRSPGAAMMLARNRMLYVTTWEGALLPLPVQILLYLLPNWYMVYATVVWSRDAAAQKMFDFWELIVLWLVVLLRYWVVAVKYGYLPAAEIEAQYSPHYQGLQLAKGIFLGGWATPQTPGFGIVEEELGTAMWLCDVDLRRCALKAPSL